MTQMQQATWRANLVLLSSTSQTEISTRKNLARVVRVAADDQNGPGLQEFAGEAVPTRSTKIGSDSKEKKSSSLVIRYHRVENNAS